MPRQKQGVTKPRVIQPVLVLLFGCICSVHAPLRAEAIIQLLIHPPRPFFLGAFQRKPTHIASFLVHWPPLRKFLANWSLDPSTPSEDLTSTELDCTPGQSCDGFCYIIIKFKFILLIHDTCYYLIPTSYSVSSRRGTSAPACN